MPRSTMATSRNRILWESPKAWRNAISHTSTSGAPISFFPCTIRWCSIGIEKDESPELMGGLEAHRASGQRICTCVDETYVRVAGQWTYLYRAIDWPVTRSIFCYRQSATGLQRKPSRELQLSARFLF